MNHFLVTVRQEKHLSASLLIFHEDGRHFYQLPPKKAVGTFASPNLEIIMGLLPLYIYIYGFDINSIRALKRQALFSLPNMSKPTKIKDDMFPCIFFRYKTIL